VAIAAHLSGDRALIEAVESGDPYLDFAKRAGLVPPTATKASHKAERDSCKAVVLGTNYGMRERSMAHRLGKHRLEAEDLLRRHRRAYPGYYDWIRDNVASAQMLGYTETLFGWPQAVAEGLSATSLQNFPMQANGAEMLRLACCLVTEAGVQVDMPVHDALLIEADLDQIEDAVATTKRLMGEAASLVLGGASIGVDASIVRFPDRYADPRGAVMWVEITTLLGGLR
jgi:DNA polymerase I-like protein with 3'-5' exonuclease and polymerase domains